MAERVRITDVSPRDGLQNEPGVIPTAEKVRLVELLCATGVDEIEVTSFVSPRWVPQLGDAAEVCEGLRGRKPSGLEFSALVPNERGFSDLLRTNDLEPDPLIDKICLFTAASESFNKRNTNATIAESFERFQPAILGAWQRRLAVKVYISCAFGCPFEGDVSAQQTARAVRLALAAVEAPRWSEVPGEFASVEISIADTIGVATPGMIHQVLEKAGPAGRDLEGAWVDVPDAAVNLHLHDTFGRAADCVKTALDLGVRSFDGSVAGLGGCPYASTPSKRAPGNISTELLVRTIEDAGYQTGLDMDALTEAAAYAREIVAKSRAGAAGSSGGTPA